MSIGTFTYAQMVSPRADVVLLTAGAEKSTASFRVGGQGAWTQVGDILRSVRMSPIRPAAQALAPKLRLVSQGLLLSEAEYKSRFEGLPIEEYRRQMPPAIFEAYLRFVGLVPGDARFDVVEATAEVDD